MPETMRSGRSPNAPRHDANTAIAGGASIACTDRSGSSSQTVRMTGGGPPLIMRPIEAPAPLRSSVGATTRTSWPSATTAAASAWMPGESTPSSLVTRMRMEPTVPARSSPSAVRPLENLRPTGERAVNSGLGRRYVPGATHLVALGLQHPDRTLLHPVVAQLHAVATEVVEELLHHVAVGAEHDVAVLHLLEQSQRLRQAGAFGEGVGGLDVDLEATGERRHGLDAADVRAAQDQVDRLLHELVDDAVGLHAADLRQGPERVVALPAAAGARPRVTDKVDGHEGTGALARSL